MLTTSIPSRQSSNEPEVEYDYDIGVTHEHHNPNDLALTTEDVEWAIEQGARSEADILRLVSEHKEQEDDSNQVSQ